MKKLIAMAMAAVCLAAEVTAGVTNVGVQAPAGKGAYLVIDLSGGANAESYPVRYLGAEPKGGWTDEYKTEKLVLRMIQPGTFTMGSPSKEMGRETDEEEHEVRISRPFYMGVFQMTQKQYQLVMGTNPSYYKGDMRPVEFVSWNTIRGNSSTNSWPNVETVDPATFIGKLRAKTGLGGFDLPTEAQWEYACRAGTTTALNSGKNLTSTSRDANMDEIGCYSYNQTVNKGGTASRHKNVGSYKPNAWGLYDMHGNVWEWCLDWYGNYDVTANLDPKGPASGSDRVMRGGGWSGHVRLCRSAGRFNYHPSNNYSGLGFRLCCAAGR